MSADIEKLAVYDGRIIQTRPKYAVEQGSLSVTNAPFSAIAQTSSQHTYNIYVPSENVFVDRAIEWSSTCYMQFSVAVAGAPLPAGQSLVVPGRDFSLCAFPLNSLCSTLTATLNDTTTTINTSDVLVPVLRLADAKKNRIQRTCPTMLDKYQSYDDAFGTLNNPLGAYDAATAYDEVPNGAYANLVFTDPNGAPLGTASPAFAGAGYNAVNGVPVSDGATAGPYQIYIRWRSTEKLVLSPFVFSDVHEMDTGLFGMNNIQLVMNLQSSPSRIIRSTSRAGRSISAVQFLAGQPAFQNSVVNVQFLTPNLAIELPPKSIVPYMEFPRYLSNVQTIAAGATQQISSPTITLPCIPDLLIVFVRPTSYAANEADWYFPVQSDAANTVRPLQINFDNFSGLLSSHTTEELYGMSVRNGLEMDYDAWIGKGRSAAGSYGAFQQGGLANLVAGALVLKPGVDISLQAGQAPSLVGNFTLQLNLSVTNTTAAPRDAQMVIITANSGFFETIRGSSRVIKGVLSEQDIISAPIAPMAVRASMERMVGGFSFSSLANVLSKARDLYEKSKPALSAARAALPEEGALGKVKGLLGKVGYGVTGAGPAGAGYAAAGKRKTLAERLL